MSKNQTDLARTFMLEHFARPELCHEYCTPDLVVHFASGKVWHSAAEAVDGLTPKNLAARETLWPPDVVIDECFGTRDRVAMRFRILFVWKETGTVVTRRELGIFHFVNDKIAEIWVYSDKFSEEKQRAAARAAKADLSQG